MVISSPGSGDELIRDLAGNISQAEIASLETIGEPLMVEPEKMQEGCMEIVDVHPLLDRVPADVICFANNLPAANSSSGHEDAEAEGVVVTSGIG